MDLPLVLLSTLGSDTWLLVPWLLLGTLGSDAWSLVPLLLLCTLGRYAGLLLWRVLQLCECCECDVQVGDVRAVGAVIGCMYVSLDRMDICIPLFVVVVVVVVASSGESVSWGDRIHALSSWESGSRISKVGITLACTGGSLVAWCGHPRNCCRVLVGWDPWNCWGVGMRRKAIEPV